jgi:hypothetical protein
VHGDGEPARNAVAYRLNDLCGDLACSFLTLARTPGSRNPESWSGTERNSARRYSVPKCSPRTASRFRRPAWACGIDGGPGTGPRGERQ